MGASGRPSDAFNLRVKNSRLWLLIYIVFLFLCVAIHFLFSLSSSVHVEKTPEDQKSSQLRKMEDSDVSPVAQDDTCSLRMLLPTELCVEQLDNLP